MMCSSALANRVRGRTRAKGNTKRRAHAKGSAK
jgi:hypothetical protein